MRRFFGIVLALAMIFSFAATAFASEIHENVGPRVDYGSAEGFVFNPTNKDMFSDFKRLMPGDTKVQEVAIKNTCNDRDVSIYMRAECYEEYKDFLDYMTIIVEMQNADKSYREIARGKASTPNELENRILLGKLEPGEQRMIKVTLHIDTSMGNPYELFEGWLDWIFICEEGDVVTTATPSTKPTQPTTETTTSVPTTKPVRNPNTGSGNHAVALVALALSMTAVVGCCAVKSKKEEIA